MLHWCGLNIKLQIIVMYYKRGFFVVVIIGGGQKTYPKNIIQDPKPSYFFPCPMGIIIIIIIIGLLSKIIEL